MHQCSTAINGCKKNEGCQCKRGYSRTDTIPETFVDNVTNRVVYQRCLICDLKIVPYNLAMMMDWDSHLNVEYSGSAYCALYLYKYCYKGASKREQIAFKLEKEHDSLDKLSCSCMVGLWVLCQQCGVYMDIKIIQHQNLLFVHLKFALVHNWRTL